MFQRRSGAMQPASKVQGRPSLGINVMGRAVDATAGVVLRATKVVFRDPLARVARSTARASSEVSGAVLATFDIRRKIWPRRRGPRNSLEARNQLREASERWTIKQEDEMEYILKELQKNFLFTELEQSQLETLVQAFEKVTFAKDQVIIHQGEPGDYFYILYKGSVIFDIDGEQVGTTTANADGDGDHEASVDESPKSFGELALFLAAPRAASAIAQTDCVLYRLDQINFRVVAQYQDKHENQQHVAVLKTVPILQDLDDDSLNALAAAITVRNFTKDQVIARKGDRITEFFVVQTGLIQVTDVVWGGANYENVLFGPGQSQHYFGFKALAQDDPLFADVSAVTDSSLLAIQGDVFRMIVGRHTEFIQRMDYARQLQAVTVFRDSHLHDEQVNALLDFMQSEHHFWKKVIVREGTIIDAALFFIRKGKLTVESQEEGYTKTLEEGAYFGQEWMLADQNKDISEEQPPLVVSKVTITAAPHTQLDILLLDDVRKVINTTLLGLGKPAQATSLDKPIPITDLTRHKMLGAGSFGQVWLATYTPPNGANQRILALKVQSKHQLIKSGQAEGVVAEVNIMKSLKSPFIIRLYSTYQDEQRVYMLTSLLQGGELEAVMGDSPMPDSVAKFYAGGILEGLTYMHRRHIIHRDLKPENVLIDSKGYPVIIDLGFAKYVPDKTYTFCGTPMYIAPEVIQYKGHDKGADHWALACIVFEMVSAKYPFYENDMAELTLFKKIIRGQFKLYGFMSFEAKLLFISLFVPDPAQRLGAKANGWQDLYNLSFFDGLDFKALRKQSLPAPWVPDLKNPLDSSNFHEMSHVEDKMTTNDPPISELEQQMFHAFDK